MNHKGTEAQKEPEWYPSDAELEDARAMMLASDPPDQPPFRCFACGHDMNNECGFAYRMNPDQAVCVCCANNEP